MKDKILIFNPHAGRNQDHRLLENIRSRGYHLVSTKHRGHGTELAREAAEQGARLIVAAGGDGTIHETATGILLSNNSPTFGIVPLGTGNDLRRSLHIPEDFTVALDTIDAGREMEIDVAKFTVDGEDTYFFNVSACGFSGEVDKHLEETDKSTWGALTYIKSGVAALQDLEPFHATIHSGTESLDVEVLNIVVGNGRYAASGIPVAAQARPNDGKLDVVLYMGQGVTDQIFNSRLILNGEQQEADTILSLRLEKTDMKFSRPVAMNYDGELYHKEVKQISYAIHSKRLKFLVGKDFNE